MPIVMQRLDRSVHFAIGFWFHAVKVYILPSETVYIPKSNSMKVQITSASPNRKWTFALQNFIRSTSRPRFIPILRLDVDVFFYLFNSTFIWIIIIRNKMECFHVHLRGSFYCDFSLCHGKSGYWLPFQYLKLLKLNYTSNYLEFVHR